MSETVDSVKRILSFNCFTERIFLCANFGIQAEHTFADNKITIDFIKIVTPNICLTSFAPASTVISFTGLPNKSYELELNFGANKITGQLNVTDSTFIATLPSQTKAQFVNTDLKRIPDNTIYGTIGFDSASRMPIVQKFIDTLLLDGATPHLYQPGDYGEFQIETNGQIKQTQDEGNYFTRYFIFNYTKSSIPLKDLVKRFGANYPVLSIALNTTRGETFYSWMH